LMNIETFHRDDSFLTKNQKKSKNPLNWHKF